jgi:hypothetical protein
MRHAGLFINYRAGRALLAGLVPLLGDFSGAMSQNEGGVSREECTRERPFTADASGDCMHPDAKLLDKGWVNLIRVGSYERYECPDCGMRLRLELPD